MEPKKEKRIFKAIRKYTLLSDMPQYGHFGIGTDIFEKTMEQFSKLIVRAEMGGDNGIHKIENYGQKK